MEPQNRPDPPSNLPAVPSRGPDADPPGSDPWATGQRASGQRPGPGQGGIPPWARRFRPRSVKAAVGLGIVGAAVLLYPFAAAASQDDNYAWWLPIGLAVGVLALITLFRLDRVMFGWAPHVAGLVLIGTLVWQTSLNPWSWGLAAGVGVALAGLLLLPRWQVLAVGAVVLVVAGIGYQFRSAELTEQRAQMDSQAGQQMRAVLGVERPQLALVSLDSGVAENNPRRVCRLVQDPALAQILQATAAPTCEQAVGVLHGRVAGSSARETTPDRNADPTVAPGASTVVDACSTTWGTAAGPTMGRVVLQRTDAAGAATYQVSGFQPC
jgi:hypothetical protein